MKLKKFYSCQRGRHHTNPAHKHVSEIGDHPNTPLPDFFIIPVETIFFFTTKYQAIPSGLQILEVV